MKIRLPEAKDREASRQGFTLLELLIASAIATGLMILLAQVLFSSQNIWLGIQAGSDAMREGRTALSILTRDMKELYTAGSRSHRLVPFYVVRASNGNSAEIAFLCRKSAMDQNPGLAVSGPDLPGDLCIVAYEIGGANRPLLLRSFSQSPATYQAIKDRIDDPGSNPDVLWHRDVDSTAVTQEVVASNVVAFDVVPMRFQRESGTPTGPLATPMKLESVFTGQAGDQWPTPKGSPQVAGDTLPLGSVYDPDYAAPDLVVIRLVLGSDERMEQLTAAERGGLQADVLADISDGRLDGKQGSTEVLGTGELQGLTLVSTALTFFNDDL